MRSDSKVPSSAFRYVGNELAIFAKALAWKRYLRRQILPFLRGRVAEVGAGLGATTPVLLAQACSDWLALEPDIELARQIPSSGPVRVFVGTLADLPIGERFDAILYIDVLEHIENDRAELKEASKRLAPGGHLVILAPAHNFLFTEFDRQIGHFRRYDGGMLRGIAPDELILLKLRYLDSAGFFASLANRLFLKQSSPGQLQIIFWDRFLVRISLVTDVLSGYRFGKSILGIWKKPG